ncbi:hypothetical protein ScPMuIL_007251 [Solemya velum]
MYLVAFATTFWLGIDDGLQIGLWMECVQEKDSDWVCVPWTNTPEFIGASRAFAVLALLSYSASCIIIIAYIAAPVLQQNRILLMSLSLITFTAACMIVMAVIIMGVKGRDHVEDIKNSISSVIRYLHKGVDPYNPCIIGTSFIFAISSSLLTYISFIFYVIEYRRVSFMSLYRAQAV